MHESTGIEEDLRRKWEEGRRRVEKPPKLRQSFGRKLAGNNLTLAELGGYRED